jgi:7-cyano-7-deazaguanine synthase
LYPKREFWPQKSRKSRITPTPYIDVNSGAFDLAQRCKAAEQTTLYRTELETLALPRDHSSMRQPRSQPVTGLLLSGGIDSAILLHELLARGWQVVPFYVRTGCVWESCELAAVARFIAAIEASAASELVVLDIPLGDLYGGHWSVSGLDVPDESTSDEAVYLPGRNPLLLLKPTLWCQMHGVDHLAIATLAGNPFPDATPEFFATWEAMTKQLDDGHVQIVRPFERLTKRRVMEVGRHLPLGLTFSCLAPAGELHCGSCNKCHERQCAFRDAGLADTTRYAKSVAAISVRR